MWWMKTWVFLFLVVFVYGYGSVYPGNMTRFVNQIFHSGDQKIISKHLDDNFILEGCTKNYTRVDVAWAIGFGRLNSNFTLDVTWVTEKEETTWFVLDVKRDMKEKWRIYMAMNNTNSKIMKGKMWQCQPNEMLEMEPDEKDAWSDDMHEIARDNATLMNIFHSCFGFVDCGGHYLTREKILEKIFANPQENFLAWPLKYAEDSINYVNLIFEFDQTKMHTGRGYRKVKVVLDRYKGRFDRGYALKCWPEAFLL